MSMQKMIKGAASTDLRHDSAIKHVTGRAEYCDDIAEPAGTLHAYLGLSTRAHAFLKSVDLDAVKNAPGVVGVLTARDIPGVNDVSSTGRNDEPIFATDKVEFWGQPIFAVVARTRDAARRAAKLAHVTYQDLPHALDPEAARDADMGYVTPPLTLKRGDAADAMAGATHRIKDRLVEFAAERWQTTADKVVFIANAVQIGREVIPFPDFIGEAYMARVHLSAAGFYKTPKIHWDRDTGKGRPFHYDAYGAACSEVSVDTLTGENTIKRSKAAGEPPFMLGISVFAASSHAVASVANDQDCPRLDAPATPECVLMAVERLRAAE